MKKGFTLVEIMVVVVIIGLLSAVGVPKLYNQVEAARIGNDIQSLYAIKNAVLAASLDDAFQEAFNKTIENKNRVFRIRMTWAVANAKNYEFQNMIVNAVKANAGKNFVEVGSSNSSNKIAIYQSKLLKSKQLDMMVLVVEYGGHYKICVLPTDSNGSANPVNVFTYRGKPLAVGDVPANGESWNGVKFKYVQLEN